MSGLWRIFEKNVGQSDKKFRLGWEFRQCSGLTCRLEQTGHLFSDPGAFPLRVGGFEILAGMDPVHSQTVGVSFKGADGGFFLKNVPLRDRKFRFGWGFPGRSGLKMHLEAPGNLHWQYQDGPRCWRGLHVKLFGFTCELQRGFPLGGGKWVIFEKKIVIFDRKFRLESEFRQGGV